MRLGLRLDAAGRNVRWLNVEAETTIARIRAALRVTPPDVLLIDDFDVFGGSAGRLLLELEQDLPDALIIAAVRSSKYELLELADTAPGRELTVPHLADSDIDDLLDALTNAGRLGELRGMSRSEQQKVFRRKANRQLLVAMIEATSGRRFDEKVESECRDLGTEAGLLYAIVAIATLHRHAVTRQDVLLAAGDASNETLNRLQGLLNRHLLVAEGELLRVRHRAIAERAVDWYRQQGQLAAPISGLLFAMATQVAPPDYRRTRPGRILARVMNHNWLRRMLADDRVAIRDIYDELQSLMDWDYHYWLQRGSFEVEVGDIDMAENFLDQARSLSDDYRVQTEWAYMMLVKAIQNPTNPDSPGRVEAAFEALEDAIERRGEIDAYPFSVMGRQGLHWLEEAQIAQEEKITLLTRLRWVANEGLRLHPSDPVLRQLERDLETAYLAIATMQAEGY